MSAQLEFHRAREAARQRLWPVAPPRVARPMPPPNPTPGPPRVRGVPERVSSVMRAVSREFGVSVDEMRGERRHKQLVRARQTAMFILYHNVLKSYDRIGVWFKYRDHTTVLHAVRTIGDKSAVDPELAQKINLIVSSLPPVDCGTRAQEGFTPARDEADTGETLLEQVSQ